MAIIAISSAKVNMDLPAVGAWYLQTKQAPSSTLMQNSVGSPRPCVTLTREDKR